MVQQLDCVDNYAAWDWCETYGDPAEAAAELFADLPDDKQEACRIDAAFFRAPEPATEEDAVQYWIECDLANENAAVRRALDKEGLCYATCPPDCNVPDCLVRWIDVNP